jgi:hypothetical protein
MVGACGGRAAQARLAERSIISQLKKPRNKASALSIGEMGGGDVMDPGEVVWVTRIVKGDNTRRSDFDSVRWCRFSTTTGTQMKA